MSFVIQVIVTEMKGGTVLAAASRTQHHDDY